MGHAKAQRLGYSPRDLDRIPSPSIDSLAGVGHHFGLAARLVLDGIKLHHASNGRLPEGPVARNRDARMRHRRDFVLHLDGPRPPAGAVVDTN